MSNGVDDSEVSQNSPSSKMLAVWPTELRKEWRTRTWYGKFWHLMYLPGYVALWAILLCLAIMLAVGFYGLKAIWRLTRVLDRVQPDTYKGENDG